MPTIIDETELARLWALACAAGDADYSAHDDADDSTKYAAAACNNVPALIAEIMRLRAENVSLREDVYALREVLDCEYEANKRHEHMVAELMEKVEAWEWFEECFEVVQWLFSSGPRNLEGFIEATTSANAAREAADADRE